MGVVFSAAVAAAGLAAVPRLVSKAGRAGHLGVRSDRRTALRAPLWQTELDRLAHDLGIDQDEIHRSYSSEANDGELELIAVRGGERKTVVVAVSHGIFRMGYQVRSRPRFVPFRFTPKNAESPEVEFTPMAAGEPLPGLGKAVRDGQVGLRFVVKVPMAAEQAEAPGDAIGVTTSQKRTRTNRDLEAAALITSFAAIPAFAALAWFAIQTLAPVHGQARLGVSIVAAVLFSSISFWMWCALAFGLAMDASPHHTEVPRSVTRSFVKFLLTWLSVMTMVNAIAGLLVAAGIAAAVH
jgi:hypothetical protein